MNLQEGVLEHILGRCAGADEPLQESVQLGAITLHEQGKCLRVAIQVGGHECLVTGLFSHRFHGANGTDIRTLHGVSEPGEGGG